MLKKVKILINSILKLSEIIYFFSEMNSIQFLDREDKKEGWRYKTNEDIRKAKVIAMYFAGGWAPPCRGFTPLLKKFYQSVNEKKYNFEIIYVSID